ncbi:MAG TPA: AAA family ATPase [Reyranella sp.]|nr:AAA family ATPase [Reyranella sp.]
MDAKPSSLRAPVAPQQDPTKPHLVSQLPPGQASVVEPAIAPALAYVLDAQSQSVVQRCFDALGLQNAKVSSGDIETATRDLARRAWPRVLLVDVSGLPDPMRKVNRLAEVCDPTTEVFVVGDKNDIVLYRDMKAAGVNEYMFKPVVTGVLTRALAPVVGGGGGERRSPRTGKLVVVLGVRGGAGATTIATQCAWFLAEQRQRRVLLLDLDLQGGDAALQLDVAPSHALREAIDHPDRIDDLFLERGVTHVTDRLGLLASLEPLSDVVPLQEDSVAELVTLLTRRHRFVIVDVPPMLAVGLPKILEAADTILLVSDGSLISAREVTRWRERIGANSAGRMTLHVHNKKGVDGSLPDDAFRRALGKPPEIVIPYDRDIARMALLGAKELNASAAIRRSMASLVRELSGAESEPAIQASIWKRMFG